MPNKPLSIPGYESIDSCGTLDSILPSMVTEGSPECEIVQSISSLCGCPTPQDSCSFCPDGTSVPLPDKQVPWLSKQFGGVAPTCGMVEAYVASLETGKTCESIQYTSSYCGCPPLTNHCKFCQGEPLKEEFYNKEMPFLLSEGFGTAGMGVTPTCELLYETQYQLENGHDFGSLCFKSRFPLIHCGCNDGELYYHGTADATKHKVLVWLPRAVGMVSLCASILVLIHILQDPNKRNASLYHQLVGTAAVFDMITSMVWIVGPAAMDTIDPESDLDLNIYGAAGNVSSCQVQSYFFQLGVTSVFLNVSLTAYFMLVIVFRYREQRLKKKRLWLFGAPIALGFALSFAVIPFTTLAFTHCQFDLTKQWVVVVFGLIPILGSSFSILVMLLIIYCSVRRQLRRQRRWQFKAASSSKNGSGRDCAHLFSLEDRRRRREEQAGRRSTLERVVFRQCLAYAAAFGVTWPIFCVAYIEGSDQNLPYGFWVFVTATSAMQGFNNSLCYFRNMENPCGVVFCCRGFRNTCYRTRGDDIDSSTSRNRLHQSTIGPRSLEEPTSTNWAQCSHLDPAVELANLSEDEDEAAVTVSSKVPEANVNAESAAVRTVSKFDVICGSGLADRHALASVQGSLEDMKQQEFEDDEVL